MGKDEVPLSSASESTPGAQPPIETVNTRQGHPHDAAAGLAAIYQTFRFTWSRMGPLRASQALIEVNKTDGFDCQSCAWPSPDSGRHIAEFCENGAKAISDEGTRRRVTPEFFQEYSIQDLLKKSDYWLNEQGRLTHPMC